MTGTDRRASRRAAYIESTTELSSIESEALAYSELGFSSSGIAKKLETTTGTVKTYLGRVIARFGPEATFVRLEFDIERDLDPVTVKDTERWTGARAAWDEVDTDASQKLTGAVWRKHAKRHPEYVPPAVRDTANIGVSES